VPSASPAPLYHVKSRSTIHIYLETGLAETRIILSYANHRGEKGRERETITIASPFFPGSDQIAGFHDATRHATLRNSAMPGPFASHPDTKARCTSYLIYLGDLPLGDR